MNDFLNDFLNITNTQSKRSDLLQAAACPALQINSVEYWYIAYIDKTFYGQGQTTFGPKDLFTNFNTCPTDTMTCVYVQYDRKNVQKVNTPFKFNGTDLVRIDKNPIPVGSYSYYIACTYNLVIKYYYSLWQYFDVIDYCETEQGFSSYSRNYYKKYSLPIQSTPLFISTYWFDMSLAYFSNCSYLSIIVGPCDQTKTEDPKVLRLTYDYYPFDNWKQIKVIYNLTEIYDKEVCFKFLRNYTVNPKNSTMISVPFRITFSQQTNLNCWLKDVNSPTTYLTYDSTPQIIFKGTDFYTALKPQCEILGYQLVYQIGKGNIQLNQNNGEVSLYKNWIGRIQLGVNVLSKYDGTFTNSFYITQICGLTNPDSMQSFSQTFNSKGDDIPGFDFDDFKSNQELCRIDQLSMYGNPFGLAHQTLELVLGKPNRAQVIKSLWKLSQTYEFYLQVTFADGNKMYVGGNKPTKFSLIVNAPNNLPYFIKPPPAYLPIDLLIYKDKLTYFDLPQVYDADSNNIITVSIQQPAPKFIFLNESKSYYILSGSQVKNYSFSIDGLEVQKYKGQNISMNIQVSDDKGGQTFYNMILQVYENIKVVVIKKIQQKRQKPFTAVISRINQHAQVNLRFSEKIKQFPDGFNITRDLNTSNLQFKVIPALNRDEEKDFNPEQLKFTWKAVDVLDQQSIAFQMKFFYPEQVSPLNEEEDLLQITWIGAENIIVAESDGAQLDQKSMVQEKKIIKQSLDTLSSSPESGGIPDFSNPMNYLRYTFYLALFLALITFGQQSGKYYVYMVRGLQDLIHIPLIACILPSRLMFFIAQTAPIVKFDPLQAVVNQIKLSYLQQGIDATDMINSYINWIQVDLAAQAEFSSEFNQQQQEIGYETRNLILNMEFLFYIFMFQCLRVIVAVISKQIIDCFKLQDPWVLQFYGLVSDGLFFKVFHVMTAEAYLEWCISVFLNLQKPIFSTFGEKFSFGFAIFVFFLLFIFLPCSIIYVMTKSPAELKDEKFGKVWGALYEDIDLKRKVALFFPLFIILQRFSLFVIMFLIPNFPLQITLLYYSNLFSIIFMGYAKPCVIPFDNQVQLFNIWANGNIIIMIITISGLNPNIEAQNTMGNLIIFEISGFFIINFGIILTFLVHDCKIDKKSCYYRCKNACKIIYKNFFPQNQQSSPDLYVLDYIKENYPKLELKELDVKEIQVKIDQNLQLLQNLETNMKTDQILLENLLKENHQNKILQQKMFQNSIESDKQQIITARLLNQNELRIEELGDNQQKVWGQMSFVDKVLIQQQYKTQQDTDQYDLLQIHENQDQEHQLSFRNKNIFESDKVIPQANAYTFDEFQNQEQLEKIVFGQNDQEETQKDLEKQILDEKVLQNNFVQENDGSQEQQIELLRKKIIEQRQNQIQLENQQLFLKHEKQKIEQENKKRAEKRKLIEENRNADGEIDYKKLQTIIDIRENVFNQIDPKKLEEDLQEFKNSFKNRNKLIKEIELYNFNVQKNESKNQSSDESQSLEEEKEEMVEKDEDEAQKKAQEEKEEQVFGELIEIGQDEGWDIIRKEGKQVKVVGEKEKEQEEIKEKDEEEKQQQQNFQDLPQTKNQFQKVINIANQFDAKSVVSNQVKQVAQSQIIKKGKSLKKKKIHLANPVNILLINNPELPTNLNEFIVYLEQNYQNSEKFSEFFTEYYDSFFYQNFNQSTYKMKSTEKKRLQEIIENIITNDETGQSLISKKNNLRIIGNQFAKQKQEQKPKTFSIENMNEKMSAFSKLLQMANAIDLKFPSK